MRLINIHTRLLEEFYGSDIPAYSRLSQTWKEGQRITFREVELQGIQQLAKSQFTKINGSCRQVENDGRWILIYIWDDTCCINTRRSSELGEAINSMFQWYKSARICYVHLEAIFFVHRFEKTRWFKRG
jgi:hypothetical protein